MKGAKVIVDTERGLFMVRVSDNLSKSATHVTHVVGHEPPRRRGDGSLALGANGLKYLVYADGSARVWTGPVAGQPGVHSMSTPPTLPMFMAKMDSAQREWIAFGRSPIAAKIALRDAFVANHPNRENLTVTEHNELLGDIYGITVIEVVAGRCYRDGEQVATQ